MARGVEIVVVDEEGAVTPEGVEARYRLRRSAGRYRLVSDTPGLLVLRRLLPDEDKEADELDIETLLTDESGELASGGRVVMAGEILSPMTLFQMVEIVGERKFRGDLHVFSSDGRWFMLALDDGALVYARSNHEADRLGALLVSAGVVDGRRLEELLQEASKGKRLGQVCLDRGVLDREALYDLLRKQAEEIFLRSLLVGDGSYVFTTPDPNRMPPALTVHIHVRALLMDGIRRLDEIELYRQVIPGGDVCLAPVVGADRTGLETDALRMLAKCNGKRTVAEVAAKCDLGQYAATRAAYFLVKRRVARIVARDKIDEGEVHRITAALASVLDDIFTAIGRHGGVESSRKMLAAWVDGVGYASYLGERVAEDGTIDPDAVLKAMRLSREEDPLSTLLHVGHELVSFALFCAGSSLPRDEELALSREVDKRLRAIRKN